MSIVLSGDSPNLTSANLSSPTITSPTISGTPVMGASLITSGTAVATTSGTSVTFTGIPSWAKKITVVFNGISTNGSASFLVQVGSGSLTTTGYVSQAGYGGSASGVDSSTSGFVVYRGSTNDIGSLIMQICSIGGNIWVSAHYGGFTNGTSNFTQSGSGNITLSGALDRIGIVTQSGHTFDAGSVNIMYE